jgi:hypothetical protein
MLFSAPLNLPVVKSSPWPEPPPVAAINSSGHQTSSKEPTLEPEESRGRGVDGIRTQDKLPVAQTEQSGDCAHRQQEHSLIHFGNRLD